MAKMVKIGLVFLLFLSGCASVEGPTIETPDISSSNEQLKQLKEENQALKEKLAEKASEVNKIAIRMPTSTQIQTALKNAKFYDGQIDGKIGSQTKEAIRKFQEANGLNPDGIVGSRTWEKLSGYLKQE